MEEPTEHRPTKKGNYHGPHWLYLGFKTINQINETINNL